jgi:hypothetical protein
MTEQASDILRGVFFLSKLVAWLVGTIWAVRRVLRSKTKDGKKRHTGAVSDGDAD